MRMNTSDSEQSLESSERKEAYVTLVTTPEYVIGAETLAKALRHTNTERPFVALVGDLVPIPAQHLLEDAGFYVVAIPDIQVKKKAVSSAIWPFANTSFGKIHVFGLHEEFEKLIYLDADTLPLENLDHLFELDLSTGYPFAAAPEMMPPDAFGTGVMVIRPSAETHQMLIQAAAETVSHDGTEQDFFNSVFPEWFAQSSNHRLPFEYNVIPSLASYYTPAWDMVRPNMKVLHFAGDASTKPWAFAGAVSPSVGLYIYLWQSIARAGRDDDIGRLFEVLNITDEAQINALFR